MSLTYDTYPEYSFKKQVFWSLLVYNMCHSLSRRTNNMYCSKGPHIMRFFGGKKKINIWKSTLNDSPLILKNHQLF